MDWSHWNGVSKNVRTVPIGISPIDSRLGSSIMGSLALRRFRRTDDGVPVVDERGDLCGARVGNVNSEAIDPARL